MKAKARFGNQGGALFPGQFVNVRIQLDTIPGAIVVPVAAVRHGIDGDFTYVLNEDSTVKLRKVRRGPTVGDMVSIPEGIAEGERVVTEGGDRLTDGQQVQLPGQAAPQRPAGQGQGQRGQRSGQRPAGAPAPGTSTPPAAPPPTTTP